MCNLKTFPRSSRANAVAGNGARDGRDNLGRGVHAKRRSRAVHARHDGGDRMSCLLLRERGKSAALAVARNRRPHPQESLDTVTWRTQTALWPLSTPGLAAGDARGRLKQSRELTPRSRTLDAHAYVEVPAAVAHSSPNGGAGRWGGWPVDGPNATRSG